MKKWILKQFIARSEITGNPVPAWMQRWVNEAELDELRATEEQLTHALKEDAEDTVPLPADLREQLDRTIQANEPVPAPARQSLFPVWIAAAAAVAAIGLYSVFFLPKGGVLLENESPTLAVVESAAESQPVHSASVETSLNTVPFSQDLLVNPLVEERARLAADMSKAIQYVAASLLPDSYAEQLNSNIESLEKEVSGSI